MTPHRLCFTPTRGESSENRRIEFPAINKEVKIFIYLRCSIILVFLIRVILNCSDCFGVQLMGIQIKNMITHQDISYILMSMCVDAPEKFQIEHVDFPDWNMYVLVVLQCPLWCVWPLITPHDVCVAVKSGLLNTGDEF